MQSIKKVILLFRRFTGWFLRWWHFSTQFKLTPFLGIVQKHQGWFWRGSDSKIQLGSKNRVKLHGFYMLEVRYRSFSHSGNSQLFVDEGQGFTADNTYLLPINSAKKIAGIAKRICYFSGYVDDCLWQPSDVPGACEGIAIKLIKLNAKKCRRLMLKKLGNIPRGDETDNHELLLSDTALYEQYSEIFQRIEPLFNYLNWHRENVVIPTYEHSTKPLISIVVTPYNANPQWLTYCLSSVVAQSYINWQLIIIANEADVEESIAVMQEYKAKGDARIKVVISAANEHACASKNRGLSEAEGEYAIFLNQHDALDCYALDELTHSIQLNPGAQLIYTDEDLMSEDGKRFAPCFKPGWNPEVLLSHNYLGQSCCYSIELLDSLGGFLEVFSGAENYDLVLRASGVLNIDNVVHVSKVLYHTRIFDDTSHAVSGQTFNVAESNLAAVQAYIVREKLNVKAKYDNERGVCCVDWQLSESPKKVTIVIVACDELHILKACLLSVLKVTLYNNFEVIIVNNGSISPETLNFLIIMSYDPRVQVISSESQLNYSFLNDLAASASTDGYLCLLDCTVEIFNPSWLIEMLSIAAREDVGCVGGKLVSPDFALNHAGENLGLGGYVSHFHKVSLPGFIDEFCWSKIRQQVYAVSGSCLLVKRSILTEVGGFDDAYTSAYASVDFCLRVNDLGYKNIYTPYAEVINNKAEFPACQSGSEDELLFNSRWQQSLQNTPFYSPNFTRSDDDFFRYE
jgi:GT2 family glycosyltransferase